MLLEFGELDVHYLKNLLDDTIVSNKLSFKIGLTFLTKHIAYQKKNYIFL
jgi:hypothetical protein